MNKIIIIITAIIIMITIILTKLIKSNYKFKIN